MESRLTTERERETFKQLLLAWLDDRLPLATRGQLHAIEKALYPVSRTLAHDD